MAGQQGGRAVAAAFLGLLIFAAGSATTLCVQRIGANTQGGDAPGCEKPATTNAVAKAAPKTEVKPAASNEIVRVEEAKFVPDTPTPFIALRFSEMPKTEDLLHFITISPAVEGVVVETESETCYWGDRVDHWVRLRSANFKYRTDYTVTVRKDTPFPEGNHLADEFRRTVKRPDVNPTVGFADNGRYLPAIGERVLMMDSVNVSKVGCDVRYVPVDNVVQLLAREEGRYKKSVGWWRDISASGSETAEIASAPNFWVEEVQNQLNVHTQHPLYLSEDRGAVSNGIYLVSVRNVDKEKDDGRDDDFNKEWGEHRLVCLTDLGLSVRQDNYGVRVWVTSLATGRPVRNAEVRLYASSRIPLARGKTGAGGEAVLSGWDARYKPFAVIVSKQDRSDAAFMALTGSMEVDEPLACGERPEHLAEDECQAFVWTERGIYRHGEPIMLHAILRDGAGNAPKPFPVEVALIKPNGETFRSETRKSDELGAVAIEDFAVSDDQPSGRWKFAVKIPGKNGKTLGEREVKIEEFVPPQIRVALKGLPGNEVTVATSFTYRVAAEQLFGGPAKMITAESLVSFADAEFSPAAWNGWRFGDADKGLTPNYTRLPGRFTDDRGEAEFQIGFDPNWGEPKAAVKMIVQGSAFESGGRPAFTREMRIVHAKPFYIGSEVPRYVRQQSGEREFGVACVNPEGTIRAGSRTLKASMSKLENVYNLVRNANGSVSWDSETVRRAVPIAETVEVGADGRGKVKIPVSGSGDYVLRLEDAESGVSHAVAFWVSADADDEMHARLKAPTSVTIAADKSLYREGDRPRLTIKAPFRGTAWLAVMRERTLYTRTFALTNVTSVVEMDELDGSLAPNVDVAISIVQAVAAGEGRLAARAHGIATLRLRTRDSEIPVKVASSVVCGERGGSDLSVKVSAPGADGAKAVVTVVDEGINLLTNEPVPDPIGKLSALRGGWHPLFDLYSRLLPVYDAQLLARGAKTGGDDMAGLMNRVSPVPTRRFRPLSRWRLELPVTNGVAATDFRLPEFVGEVRVTAVVYGRRATGSAAVQQKVCPKLVMQPDAPRFAAPGDRIALTLAIHNRSGKDAEIAYEVLAAGAVRLETANEGKIAIKDGDSKIITLPAVATAIGEGEIVYRASGCGEKHEETIRLPVRPAVPWVETADVVRLRPDDSFVSKNVSGAGAMPELTRRSFAVASSPMAELVAAFDWLAEYPHGCLEQTTSRMFPLIYGEGILKRLPSEKTSKASELKDIVEAGTGRIVSMLRANDFTMWPDVDCRPWNREVSLYAAHYLVEAWNSGVKVPQPTQKHLKELLAKWAHEADTNVAAYACHTLALAGAPDRDRMLALYDVRARLSLLSRARLARGFLRSGDPVVARELLADAAVDPKDVREAAFALLAMIEMDANDERIPKLVLWLQQHRDRERCHWGTTEANAHALLALAAYYRTQDPGDGEPEVKVRGEGEGEGEGERLEAGKTLWMTGGVDVVVKNTGKSDAYVTMKRVALPSVDSVRDEHRMIRVSRKFYTSEGADVDLAKLSRGDLLVAEITLSADEPHDFTDLVIQDLLPACLEPDRKEVAQVFARCHAKGRTDWVLRSDIRDDRVLVFSKPVTLAPMVTPDKEVKFFYAVRAVTAGECVLPGVRVEAMYSPEVKAQSSSSRIIVK